MKIKKVVVIGGGTGTSVVLSGLKDHQHLDITAIVTASDSGGSTGRLRDEFGFIPVGDMRQCLAALASGENQDYVRQVLLYRFAKGDGLKGHNLGNLILTALEDIAHSPAKAIEIASQIFRINGRVYPITEETVDLVIEYGDGTILIGEDYLNFQKNGGKKIKQIKLSPRAKIYQKAKEVIEKADLIVLGPGDLYASLLANTVVSGFPQALAKNQGKFVYIVNLMTHFTQTHQMTALDHIKEVTKYCQRSPDIVIMNQQSIPKNDLEMYAQNQEFMVVDDLTGKLDFKVIKGDFISKIQPKKVIGDALERSLLRHDQKKLTQTLLKLI